MDKVKTNENEDYWTICDICGYRTNKDGKSGMHLKNTGHNSYSTMNDKNYKWWFECAKCHMKFSDMESTRSHNSAKCIYNLGSAIILSR